MRFTLPTLITTLSMVVLVGCNNDRRAALPDRSAEAPMSAGDPATAENNLGAADNDLVGDGLKDDPLTTTADINEPLTEPRQSLFDENRLVVDDAISTPVALPQASSGGTADAEQSMAQQESEIRADNCMVQYFNKINVPAQVEGILMEMGFEEGDTINQDDVLAVIDDRTAKLAIELKKAEYKEAMINAANDVNLEDAVNSEKLAKAEANAYKELLREGAIPYWEMEKKRLEADRATLRIELAEMQKKIAEVQMIAKRSELDIANFELTRRQITAPATGFVEARIAQLGEWVQPGSPIATVIQMDRLRVEGDIDALRYPRAVRQGTPVDVTIYSEADKVMKIKGKLGYVSMEIDLNNRYRVWVEVENKKVGDDWMIKPGMRAEIVIRPTSQLF